MNNFNNVEYAPLRIWNRCVMLFNINEDSGVEAASVYLKQFSKPELTELLDMYNRVKKEGREPVLREIMRNMPTQEFVEEEVDAS